MKEEPKTQHLNIFLVKPDFTTIDQIIREADCSKHFALDIPEFGPSHFYIK